MKLLKGSIAALITPFIDDADQSVNRKKPAKPVKLPVVGALPHRNNMSQQVHFKLRN